MTSNRIIDFGKLDANYYLEAFYQFSMNKLIYETSGQFGAFQELIYGYGKAEKSPIVYEIKNDYSCGYADILANKEVLFPKSRAIETYAKIGCVEGSEFFADGNDIYVLFDSKNDSVININHYS